MDITTKSTGDSLTAAEFMQIVTELENLIEDTGITLSNADLEQVSKSLANYSSGGDFFTDSGAADAYVLTAIGNKKGPTSYADGLRVRFIVGTTNTGASTVNVSALGAKNIVRENGSALQAGDLFTNETVELVYDSGNNRFYLSSSTRAKINFFANISTKTADYTILTTDGIRTILVSDVTAARTMTLPPAASSLNRIITIKKTASAANKVTIDGNEAETIDGIASFELYSQYDFVTVQCDGTSWHVIEKKQTVVVSANNCTTTVNSGATTPLIYATEVVDTANIYNTTTGVATIGVAGDYNFSAGYELTSSTGWGSTESLTIIAAVNVSSVHEDQFRLVSGDMSGAARTISKATSGILERLSVGDTVQIKAVQTNGANLAVLNNSKGFFRLKLVS